MAGRVILGVDPGGTAGWALIIDGALMDCGTVKTWGGHDVRSVVERAVAVAAGTKREFHLVVEHWPAAYAGRSSQTWLGLGEARGPWRYEFNAAVRACKGLTLAGRYHKAEVNVWRRTLFGPGSIKTDVAKERALEWVAENTGRIIESHDAAEAVCIAMFGIELIEGRVSLPKKKGRGKKRI
jgi:hypothetical protein